MANSKQAIKRAKQNAETYKLRHAQRSMVRTAVKAVRASIEANDSAFCFALLIACFELAILSFKN